MFLISLCPEEDDFDRNTGIVTLFDDGNFIDPSKRGKVKNISLSCTYSMKEGEVIKLQRN